MWYVGYIEKGDDGLYLTYTFKNKVFNNALKNMVKSIKNWDDLEEYVEIEVQYNQVTVPGTNILDGAFIVTGYWDKNNPGTDRARLDWGYIWNNPVNTKYCIISGESNLFNRLRGKYHDRI